MGNGRYPEPILEVEHPADAGVGRIAKRRTAIACVWPIPWLLARLARMTLGDIDDALEAVLGMDDRTENPRPPRRGGGPAFLRPKLWEVARGGADMLTQNPTPVEDHHS